FATDLAAGLIKRMSNPKLHWKPAFASSPLVLTFANMAAGTENECQNRTARRHLAAHTVISYPFRYFFSGAPLACLPFGKGIIVRAFATIASGTSRWPH